MGPSVYFFCVWTLTLWGFFSISQACIQEGIECARSMQTGEMRMDQLDQMCPKFSAAFSCLEAALATCTSDAERSPLNSMKTALGQQFNTLCSGGCSISDIMRCSPKNMEQLSTLNEETCQAVRQMKVCFTEVRANCNKEDTKAQIDMQIQSADRMLAHCASITSEPTKKKKMKKIKKIKKIKNLKKDENEDKKKKKKKQRRPRFLF
ncbi:hypothetical protein Bpfe_020946 [Biomphalaria pfeifferi]|uniref:IMS import disulfide relay-system CHCH-CHCH-like Cx9C domain-containing protein n=1 Tax=Biomphalaria pfeifferi TaxID=112525 RepID=A0AAD8B7X1_BIOPF|nr:hypothetical protein Bpfe_020946 [Biomphalaria pfeifferi]